eukprot:2437482-Rhodomonas_salina.2
MPQYRTARRARNAYLVFDLELLEVDEVQLVRELLVPQHGLGQCRTPRGRSVGPQSCSTTVMASVSTGHSVVDA